MPKIQQYQPDQVQTQISSQPRAQGAPAGAFGAPVAKGVFDLVQAGAELKQRVDTTSAEEALVQFERDKNELFFNADNGYFNTQGKNAYDNSTAASKSLEDLKMKYGEALGAQAKLMFDKSADQHITRSQMDISRHAAKGLKAWEVSTIEAQVENSIENASLYWSDPDRLKVQNVLGRQAVSDSADMMGLSAEAKAEKLQTFESSFAKSTVEAATQSSAIEGKDALESYGDRLEGPDKIKMQKQIEAKEKVEKTEVDARAATLTAGKLVGQYDTKAEVIEEVNKIEDPDLRKKTMTEAMSQYTRKQQAEREVAKNAYHDVIGQVNQGASATQIQAQNPEAWLAMDDAQRNNILSGKHMVTDQVLLSKLRSLPTKEKAAIDVTEYVSQLKPSDYQKLTTEVEAAKKGDPGSRVKSLVSKSMQAAESAFGKNSKWTTGKGKPTEKGEKANQFLNDLQDAIDEFEADKGSKVTPAEENEIINEFTRQIVSERSAFGLDILAADVEIDLSNAPANDVRLLNRVINNTPDVDLTDLTDAYQFLIDNNQPVTANNLNVVYKQGRQ